MPAYLATMRQVPESGGSTSFDALQYKQLLLHCNRDLKLSNVFCAAQFSGRAEKSPCNTVLAYTNDGNRS